MGSMSLVHWLVVAVIVILLFGGSRFSNMMGDVAKGIKQFKKGMSEDDETSTPTTRLEAHKPVEPAFTPEKERTPDERR
ncbi:twin-arginine translocase TatA/TatE family subunit [Sphingomonas sp. RS2018]